MITTSKPGSDIVRKVIDIYNTRRPHSSVEMLTPEEAHAKKVPKKKKKNGKLFINVNKLFFYEQDQTDIFATK